MTRQILLQTRGDAVDVLRSLNTWSFWANCITDGYIVVMPLTLSGKSGYVLEIGAPLEPLKTVEVTIRWP